MALNDPERRERLRLAVRYLLSKDALERGHQSRLARHFAVSRQWVHQVVNQERRQHLVRGEINALKATFRASSARGDWQSCVDAAAALTRLCANEDEAAQALYALGYANEKLRNLEQAANAYREVLTIQRGHLRARARLAAISANALAPVPAVQS